ncbi:corrinoid methyltransferase [Clostridia bacterium]|nr:corrinoid methyltransferase [Clostridia bacterium]
MLFEELSVAVQRGRSDEVVSLIEKGIAEGESAQDILNNGLLAGMNILGEKFKNHQAFVPEVLVAARALNNGTALLREQLISEGVKSSGTVVLATVAGDLHDIGKNLVKMMLEGAGFEVIDLGVDINTNRIVDAVIEHKPDILALSALLTTTMGQLAIVMEALEEAGIRDSVKVMIGGAPVDADYRRKIGADLYAADAAEAATVAKEAVRKEG